MQKRVLFILVIIVLSIISLSLAGMNINLRRTIKELAEKKDVEFKKLLKEEKEKIREDLNELYRADMVSYQAMAKRLEIEKKKKKELEKELEKLKKEKTNPKSKKNSN